MMVTLVIEFGRQRRKFDLKHPIDTSVLENQIKLAFGIDEKSDCEYLIQIYDEQVNDYLDLTFDSFISTNNNLIKGQIISRQCNSFQFQPKVTKQQVVGLITLESIQDSLQQWSQLLQHIQLEIAKELQTVKETIEAVKSHYQLVDEFNTDNLSPVYPLTSNCSSPSTVSQQVNKTLPPPTNSHSIRPINQNIEQKDSYQPRHRPNINRRGGISNHQTTTRENHFYYPPSQIPSRPIEYHIPVIVTYQRFQSGVDFEGELSKYYNPTYFFLRISNQTESYDEMHQHINLYYNSIDLNKSYFPQSGEFCAAKSSTDSNWYRARIIRLLGNEKVQLIFIDNGAIAELNVNCIQPLNNQFSDRPAQALACTLAQVLPFTQNDQCGWNRRACMSLENSLKTEQNKALLKVTIADMNQVKWPMMFVHISTSTISSLTDHMCDLYLSRRATNAEISDYWSMKIRPEQYVLFNLSSLINQKQYFNFNNHSHSQSTLSFDQTIDLLLSDLELFSR